MPANFRTIPPQPGRLVVRVVALLSAVLLTTPGLFAQDQNEKDKGQPAASKTATLGEDERAELLRLIRTLQERVDKLEAAQATTSNTVKTTTLPDRASDESSIDPAKAPNVLPTDPPAGNKSQDK